MPMIICKVESKLKWAKHFTLSVLGNKNDNVNVDSNNIFSTIKDTKLHVPVVTLLEKGNQKLSKLLSKEFLRSVYWNGNKAETENKNTTSEYKYFTESTFVGVNNMKK